MIDIKELIKNCKKNSVKKLIKNKVYNQSEKTNLNLIETERFLYKLYQNIREENIKVNNNIKEEKIYKFIQKKNSDLLNDFFEGLNISKINIDKGDSFIRSILVLIDSDFYSMTTLMQNKVLNIIKKELAIKFIEDKHSKEFNLRKYKLKKTDIQRILLNDEPINIIIKQFISRYIDLNILIFEDNTVSSIDNFKLYKGSILLQLKDNIYKPILINDKNYIYDIPIEKIKKYNLLQNEEEELKISKKYTSKELSKMKILDIHIIAKSLDISILNDENKKKIKKNLIEEIVQTY